VYSENFFKWGRKSLGSNHKQINFIISQAFRFTYN
jgi:hypothetical protein